MSRRRAQLWKFQQEHRPTLETHGGLRRAQIGEVASRIGQLYYLFYLRKGDTKNGNAIEVWSCNQASSESWYYDSVNHNIQYGPDKTKCIDAGDLKPGTKLQIVSGGAVACCRAWLATVS